MPASVFGPVFRAELLRSSRRRRYYVLRVAYGLILLLLIMTRFGWLYALQETRGGELFIADLAEFAHSMFMAFLALQLVTILLVVPAIVGGVIADERQRKTLHYLMASRLSSGEIILDKLGARLCHVGSFVLLGVPVLCLLNLLGGVSWEYVVVAYAATAAVGFFVAALAVLASTFARRVRQAVLLAYLLEVIWLAAPVVGIVLGTLYFNSQAFWLNAFQTWVPIVCPLLLWDFTFEWPMPLPRIFRTPGALLEPYLWSIGLQVAGALLLLLFAMARLRPIFRRQEGSVPRFTWFAPKRKRPRWVVKPPCGADAMLWKERYFARTDIFTKMVVLPATIVFTVAMVLGSGIDESLVRAASELFREGLSSLGYSRNALTTQLRMISPYYVGLWLLAVAGASASSVTTEREQDTWTSLISTPLTGAEILRGKMLGAVWGLRGFGALLGLFWVVGLIAGGVHPVGLLIALVVLALFTWFVAALGTYASLTQRSTSKALTVTLLTLMLLNGGYLLPLMPLTLIVDPPSWFLAKFSVVPYIVSHALLSSQEVPLLAEALAHPHTFLGHPAAYALDFCLVLMLGYTIGAAVLTTLSIARFDRILDRPVLGDEAPPARLKPRAKSILTDARTASTALE